MLRSLHRVLLGGVLLAFFGLQALELSHHHESASAQETCAICQIAAHQPLHLELPILAVAGMLLFLLFFLGQFQLADLSIQPGRTAYRSRAPPSRTAGEHAD